MKWISRAVYAFLLVLALISLRVWYQRVQSFRFSTRVPGADPEANSATDGGAGDGIKTVFEPGTAKPSDLPGSWPNFRGPDFDNISKEEIKLAATWPADGPDVRWTQTFGDGHAGPAVANGRVYVLDYDEEREGDALRCLSLADGLEIWRRWYPVKVKRNHGRSRTVPAVGGGSVVTIGPKCHVMCTDAETGELKWFLDLVREFGTTVPLWYTAQCPLIDDGIAVIAPAGTKLMMGVSCDSGEIVWETANPDGWKMSHASITPATVLGKRVYVYPAVGGVVAVSAEEGDRGSVVWKTTDWSNRTTAPSAVPISAGRLFFTAGHGAGSIMLRVTRAETSFVCQTEYRLDKTVFSSEQQTPLFYDNHLFGILPKDAGDLKNQFACVRTDGELAWSSGKEKRFGLGPYVIGDGKILTLSDDGTLTMLAATTEGYVQLAQAKMMDGRDAWGPLVLVGGRLILRESYLMMCVDLRKGT